MASAVVNIRVLGDEIVIQAPFRYVELCRALPNRRFDGDEKAWCCPVIPSVIRAVHDTFSACTVNGDDAWRALVSAIVVEKSTAPENHAIAARSVKPPKLVKTKPWEHQSKGVALIVDQPATMLAFDMGTGKSKVAVDAIVNLGAQLTLIICPLAVVPVWPKQFAIHAARPVRVLALNKGSTVGRAASLQHQVRLSQVRGEAVAIVVNYESAWRESLAETIQAAPWDLIILDESHRIKSPKGKASKFFATMHRRCKRRLCLTGTPMPHSPLDCWAQYRFLDPTIFGTSFVAFRNRYTRMGGFGGHEILGYQNLDELTTKFYSIAMRVSKDEVLDLPEVVHEQIPIELSDEAWRVYEELESRLVAEVEGGVVTAANALSRLLRLQQVTSGYAAVKEEAGSSESTPTVIDDAKISALSDILEDLPPREPVVVFSRFTQDLARIKEIAAAVKRRSFELSGAAKELEAWQASKTGDVLAVQIQAGGVGVDFTRARYCVYYSLGYSLGDYEQSLARIHRPGQKRKVTYLHLVATQTIDEEVYAALQNKKQVVEHVLEKIRCPKQQEK